MIKKLKKIVKTGKKNLSLVMGGKMPMMKKVAKANTKATATPKLKFKMSKKGVISKKK